MIAQLANFDPITYLNIDQASYSDQELGQLRQDLMAKIGEYVLLKLSQDFTDEQVNYLAGMDGQAVFNTLQTHVPDFENKFMLELDNFKKDYEVEVGGASHV